MKTARLFPFGGQCRGAEKREHEQGPSFLLDALFTFLLGCRPGSALCRHQAVTCQRPAKSRMKRRGGDSLPRWNSSGTVSLANATICLVAQPKGHSDSTTCPVSASFPPVSCFSHRLHLSLILPDTLIPQLGEPPGTEDSARGSPNSAPFPACLSGWSVASPVD